MLRLVPSRAPYADRAGPDPRPDSPQLCVVEGQPEEGGRRHVGADALQQQVVSHRRCGLHAVADGQLQQHTQGRHRGGTTGGCRLFCVEGCSRQAYIVN